MLTLDEANGEHEFGSNIEERFHFWSSYVNPAMRNYRLLTLAAKTKLLNTLSETTLFTEPDIEAMEMYAEAKARYKYRGDTVMYEKYYKEYKKAMGGQPVFTPPFILVFIYYAVTTEPEIILNNSLMVTRAVNYIHGAYQSHLLCKKHALSIMVAKHLVTGEALPDNIPEYTGMNVNNHPVARYRRFEEKHKIKG